LVNVKAIFDCVVFQTCDFLRILDDSHRALAICFFKVDALCSLNIINAIHSKILVVSIKNVDVNATLSETPDEFGTASLSIKFNEASVFFASKKELAHWSLELDNNGVVTSHKLRLEDVRNWKWPDEGLHLAEHC